MLQDMSTYEETRLRKDPSTWGKYLKEGMSVALLLWNGKVGSFLGAVGLAVMFSFLGGVCGLAEGPAGGV